MASNGIFIAIIFAATLCGGAMAQSSCSNALASMAPCLNYITGNSSTPSSTCCMRLVTVVQASPQCLCQVLNSSGVTLGVTINQTLSLSLPGACQVQTPPIRQCNAVATAPTPSAAITPVSSPAIAPSTDSSRETPQQPAITPSASEIPSASGSGSKTVPSTKSGTSDASLIKAPIQFILLLLVVAFGDLSFAKL